MPRRSNIPNQIISLLVEKPTATREEIRKRLGVSYQAVQKHLYTLQEQKIVLPSFRVAEKNIKKYLFWIFILTKYPSDENEEAGNDYQRNLCDEISKSLHEESDFTRGLIFGGAHIIIGGTYDIILQLYSDNPDSVGRYVTRFLRPNPAVVSTSTAWSLTESAMERT
jgi:DNA-binding Lrp family transcriptional regulator